MVESTAKIWGLPSAFIQAMVDAEGGPEAFLKAVRCSIPSCLNFIQAVEIACRSVSHRAFDYAFSDTDQDFISYLGSFWCPVGAANDPTHLNENWVTNVKSRYASLLKK